MFTRSFLYNSNIGKPKEIMSGVKSISLGQNHTGVIKTDGSLRLWGFNYSGQVGCGISKNCKKPKKINLVKKDPVLVSKITLSAVSQEIAPNCEFKLKVKITPNNATNKNYTWKFNGDIMCPTTKNVFFTYDAGKGKSGTITAVAEDGSKVKGLNTAATLWCVAAIGTLTATGMIFEATIGTILVLVSNIILRSISYKIMNKARQQQKEKCSLRKDNSSGGQ